MSNVSVLSAEYRNASDLSEALNALMIALKKARLNMLEPDGQAEFAESRARLATILDTLTRLLDTTDGGTVSGVIASQIPGGLVNQVRLEHQGDMEWYLTDLRTIRDRLRSRWSELTPQNIEQLDHLATMADAESSDVFRQLMRR
jgi:hypothetical protein